MASSEVKDKTDITNARKEIERRMERFKLVEKEAKTKTFSKEGLNRANADPKERARAEMRDWLTSTVDTLNTQARGSRRLAGGGESSMCVFPGRVRGGARTCAGCDHQPGQPAGRPLGGSVQGSAEQRR
jgi:hypothetical protein